MAKPVNHLYEFDSFRVDAQKRLLLRHGEVLPLTPKAFDTLLALIEYRGRLIEKDELMQTVWPDTIVEESALARNIYLLRKTLGESPDEHRYIVTVPGRGYRFVAGVSELSGDPVNELIRSEPAEVVATTRTRASIVTEVEEDWEKEGAREGEGVSKLSSMSPSLPPALPPSLRLSLLPSRFPSSSRFIFGGVLVALAAMAGYWMFARGTDRSLKAQQVRSIAILPFKPLVAESGDEYLQMGMADVLITRLSNIKQLVVRPVSAVRKYNAIDQDSITAGRELKVDAVLEGNIQRAGDRVRLTVRLVDTRDGATLWAEKFDQKFTDIFGVEDAISERLAGTLALKLTGEEKALLSKRYTDNAEAYQAYLKGRYFWSKWTKSSLEKSIESFEQALRADPDYAPAHSGLADAHNLLGYLGFVRPQEAFPKSEASALRALQIDDTLGEAHISLAKTKLFYNWDWAGCEKEIKRALDLNPNYADAHGMNGTYLLAMGRFDEALAARKRAIELDPISPLFTTSVGWVYYYMRRYDQAIEWYKKAVELDTHFIQAQEDIGQSFYKLGQYDQAVAVWLKAKTLAGAGPETITALREGYAAAGITGYWKKELELAIERQKQGNVRPWRMARIHAELHENDEAFRWLNKAYEDRESLLVFLKVIPNFDNLRSDDRFAELLRRVGLTQDWK